MSRFRRASLGPDFGYVPGEQPPDDGSWLKLNTNESPLPPSSRVGAAMEEAAAGLRRYPDPFGEPLRSALADYHGVAAEQVLVVNGADQAIDCCFRAFCEPGDTVVWPDLTYSLFPVLARVFGVTPAEVALDDGFAIPAALGTAPGALRFAVNPNSPTGVWTSPGAVEELLGGAPGVVVIDEAYCDFAPQSCLPLLANHDNFLILRTFSKSHALAGLRVGYAMGSAELIDDLAAVKDSYPVDRCAIAGALAGLQDEAHHRAIVDSVVAERTRLTRRLRTARWEVPESGANFVFARPPDGDARAVQRRLRDARILVRHFATVPDRLRITVGAPAENDRLLDTLGV
ncbi:MAG TPA: histidinol-phosphate transaminase [Candidatus Dormibacteraeota bacterium]|jgi:histidinol-phosphate aminotransferase|nr:histidinol-phosphate transaminase [Candidatus Dormibacteraeota bacterium]